MELGKEDGIKARSFGHLRLDKQLAKEIVEALTDSLNRKNDPVFHE
tara:strand:+ start:520 stop:657 length:138 start_codon:yes stop_codon:yes gene_type:complete